MKSRISIVALALVAAAFAAAPAEADPLEDKLDLVESYGDLDICGTYALPVTTELGGGDSSFQFFQDPAASDTPARIYVTWSLVANTLNNGADDWVFGLEIKNPGQSNGFSKVWRNRGGHCEYVGAAKPGFRYEVEGGATGWTSERSCTLGFTWDVTVGMEFSLTDSGGKVEQRLGYSASCTRGGTLDSDKILDDIGTAKATLPVTVANAFATGDRLL